MIPMCIFFLYIFVVAIVKALSYMYRGSIKWKYIPSREINCKIIQLLGRVPHLFMIHEHKSNLRVVATVVHVKV